jgi:hypothetical protein
VQTAPTQACGVQSVVPPATQVPVPSHFEAPTSVAVPGVQAAAGPQLVPDATGAQTPVPVTLQAAQVPHELLVQQTPSVHMPLKQSVPAPQVAPFALRLVQVPEMQLVPVTQSPFPAQVVRQAVVPHMKWPGQG